VTAIKKLAGQTAIYGIPGILGRILGYLLVPLYTRVFAPGEYGTVNVFYSYASFLMVVLTYGMETAFFRFHQQETEKERVFSTGMISLLLTSGVFIFFIVAFAGPIAGWIDYADHPEYVIWFGFILTLDVVSAIPFARLRAQNKPRRFAAIKLAGIIINIALNLFFILLCPYILKHYDGFLRNAVNAVYRSDWGIEYIFVSNLIASAIVLLLLLPEILSTKWKINPDLWKRMLLYAFPLLFAGMAGIVNETFDRLLLRYLLPHDIAEYQVGIYSACYKISILMTIFIQAYKYAAEPFFFSHAKDKNARVVYARIMDYFVITVAIIFLGTMVYLDDVVLPFLIDKDYWEGRRVIPVLMLANLFLGVYYNLSIWYKLTGKTIWGAWFSVIGAIITLILNFWWIPLTADHLISGYYGSAWATFICYALMMILSYVFGQKYYRIEYNLKKFFGYLGLSVFLYFASTLVKIDSRLLSFTFHSFLLAGFLTIIIFIEKPGLVKGFIMRRTAK
jgi:O-antigen/teichoic acid export membrane protein